MSTAAANPKPRKARKQKPAATPPATPTEAMREARAEASSPDRVARLHLERLVFDAVIQCRPGTTRGAASGLWQERHKGGIGLEGVHLAARLYLIDFLSAAKVRVRLGLPAGQQRKLDRLLYVIQEKHSALLTKDQLERHAAEEFSPVNGDVAAKADAVLEGAFDRMLPVVKRLNWDECEASERNNLMRFFEVAASAKKISTDARHKEAQTERLERMLRAAADEAAQKGQSTVSLTDFRAIIDQAFGLSAPAPAPGKEAAAA